MNALRPAQPYIEAIIQESEKQYPKGREAILRKLMACIGDNQIAAVYMDMESHEMTESKENKGPNLICALVLLLALSTMGCNNLKRITDGAEHHEPDPVPTFVQGTTSHDFQTVTPVNTNGLVLVSVRKAGATSYRQLNEYEYDQNINEIKFKKEAYPTYSPDGTLIKLVITTKPAAPQGTQFRIETIR